MIGRRRRRPGWDVPYSQRLAERAADTIFDWLVVAWALGFTMGAIVVYLFGGRA